MSIVIKFGNSTDETSLSGAIYFDVVTQYSKDLGGQVTAHPIEAGASITDHYISRNPKYSFSGVISHVDFSGISSKIKIDDELVMNNLDMPLPVSVDDSSSGLMKLLPGVIEQFVGASRPEIIMDENERLNYRLSIENFFEILMNGLYYNENRQRWENRMVPCTLFEMEGPNPVKPINDLVCTSVQIKETPDTGDALFVDISFEKVQFATSEKVDAPRPARKTATERATADTSNKGNKPANTDDPTNEPKDRNTVLQQVQLGNQNILN